MKKLFSTLLLLTSFISYAQFPLHGGAMAGSGLGISSDPYNNPFLNIDVLGGGEMGFRFTDRLEIRGLAYFGNTSKDILVDETPSSSKIIQLGLKPQFALLFAPANRHNLDLGLPITYITQRVSWTKYSSDYTNPSQLSIGLDEARLLSFGLAPSYRFYAQKTGFTYQIGVTFNHVILLEANRNIYTPWEAPDKFGENEMRVQPWQVGAFFTLGYVFR